VRLHFRGRSLSLSAALFLFGVGMISAPVHADDWRVDSAGRVVAIADIHGAFAAMVETLQHAGVIDGELRWSGESTHLVIVGDILDRGPRSRDAMDLLMRLEQEAPLAGGSVLVLIGNHESMNLIGDLRYVSREEYAAFADDETDEQRERGFVAYAARHGADASDVGLRQKFEQEFPKGYFALRRAFRPDAKYGEWLLSKPVIGVLNGTAFVHGGLSPTVTKLGLDGVNRDLKKEFREYVEGISVLTDAGILLPTDSYYDTPQLLDAHQPASDEPPAVTQAVATVKTLADSELFDADGPLWYRGNVSCGELIEEPRLLAALEAIGADRLVVGHTPTPNRRVLQRFDGKLIEIDTGMLNDYYKGSGNALVLDGDKLAVLNQRGGEMTVPADHPRNVGTRPGRMSADELQELLEVGDIVSRQVDASGMTVVKVSDGQRMVSALFSRRQRRGVYPGVAAYRLDRLLDLEMVPVTAVREVGGVAGSLQFVTNRYLDEEQRAASGRGGGAPCAIPDQWEAMLVFDALIYNEGRSKRRMLYDSATWKLLLVGHDRAFASRKGRPRHLESMALELTRGWETALNGLDDTLLDETFSDVLDKRRIRALSQRRDELLASLQK
jgi:hypothetical protein